MTLEGVECQHFSGAKHRAGSSTAVALEKRSDRAGLSAKLVA